MNLVHKPQKIANLSVSVGAGHVREAQALQAATEKWYPGGEAMHVNLIKDTSYLR